MKGRKGEDGRVLDGSQVDGRQVAGLRSSRRRVRMTLSEERTVCRDSAFSSASHHKACSQMEVAAQIQTAHTYQVPYYCPYRTSPIPPAQMEFLLVLRKQDHTSSVRGDLSFRMERERDDTCVRGDLSFSQRGSKMIPV